MKQFLPINEFISSNYGKLAWQKIVQQASHQGNRTNGKTIYGHQHHSSMMDLLSTELKTSQAELMVAFGKEWVRSAYESRMESLGHRSHLGLLDSFKFLSAETHQIPFWKNFVISVSLKVQEVDEQCIIIHCFSNYTKIRSFVRGVLLGLGEMCDRHITIDQIEYKLDYGHDVFEVNW